MVSSAMLAAEDPLDSNSERNKVPLDSNSERNKVPLDSNSERKIRYPWTLFRDK